MFVEETGTCWIGRGSPDPEMPPAELSSPTIMAGRWNGRQQQLATCGSCSRSSPGPREAGEVQTLG